MGTASGLDIKNGPALTWDSFWSQGEPPMPLKSRLKASTVSDRGRDQSEPDKVVGAPKTMSIPEAGHLYFGLSKNGSYDAAQRGEIPYFRVGRLKRVSIAKMEQMMLEGANVAPPAAYRDAGQEARHAHEISALDRSAARIARADARAPRHKLSRRPFDRRPSSNHF